MRALQLKDTWGFHPDQSWFLQNERATAPHQFQQAEIRPNSSLTLYCKEESEDELVLVMNSLMNIL